MDAAEVIIKFPIKTKLVCSSCGAPGEGSCRCGAPYVTPEERAEAAVKTNPGKSDRMLAEEAGVNRRTIVKARKQLVHGAPVEKRTGRDGRKRQMPKTDKVRQAVADLVVAGKAVSRKKIGEQFGVGDHPVQLAIAAERAKHELLKELDIDPTTLAPSAQAKLEIAKRTMERKLQAEHAVRMRRVDEEVRQRVLKEGVEYIERMKVLEDKAWKEEKHYREMNEKLKHPLTKSEWYLLHKCVHNRGNAAHPEDLDAAATLLNVKRDALLGGKK